MAATQFSALPTHIQHIVITGLEREIDELQQKLRSSNGSHGLRSDESGWYERDLARVQALRDSFLTR